MAFIKIDRKVFDHFLWTENRVYSKFEAWLDLIQLVSYTEDNEKIINGVVIKWQRGEYPVSYSFLSKRWNWSAQRVRGYMQLLKCNKQINTRTTSVTTILTLCNYDKYNNGQQADEFKTTSEATSGQQADNKRTTINKEDKESKKDIDKRKSDFENYVFEYDPLKYSQELLKDFCSYWTEKNKKGDKMRFEAEKFFDIGRRLATWNKNNSKFSKDKYEPEIIRPVFRPYPTK